ncbi:adenosylcobalamin-dependent ribonucleoside-diphosphate reductase [Paenibacillus protaetiae]|uniref:Vitamin B12-dependent ribonucleotide reductase n=1 Tax=Paenibacillus protaetiae TaxID=2509456 RepID=A0A4P6ES11_9BACL|nr:adenosylcobalamin-dependent ribonucleoside-diphosphate reductase [Paenibacillus protaetiae]QAY65336.1 adenosylcobalamin-dependent ribonucleoside-diphosphate reductase [Paenibacillus protaetiae]
MEKRTSAGRTKLAGLSEKIFLDRYALKQQGAKQVAPGDVVLVTTKEDSKFPAKEVGEIAAINGRTAEVRLRSGETVQAEVERLSVTAEQSPEQMWDRLAATMAEVEPDAEKKALWREKFRYALEDWKLVPGGRIAAGAGAGEELTLFNCYVIPSPLDSRGGIMQTLSEMTEIMSRGGGVGINLSSLRPRRANVVGVNGKSSGAVSWGGLFSYATGLIEQGGSRRGALMLMLNDWHPDVLEFITVKQTMGQVTNANLSICVSNGFMQAVKGDLDWELVFPDTTDPEYDELWRGDLQDWRSRGKPVIPYKKLKARDIWHQIIESAWKSAEPGVVFMERYNELSNSWYFNPIISTNPCGEQGLPAWGVCNLSAINLSRFYDEAAHDVDWSELATITRYAVRFLDNVIDATPYHFEQNEQNQKRERRIGLGSMGLAELMIKLGIRYGSPESLDFLDRLYRFIAREAYLASADIAAEKGSFLAFDEAKFVQSGFMKQMIGQFPEVGEAIGRSGMRNVTVLTQAPTGSTGTMVGTSTGIEPYFAFEYYRQSRLGFDKQLVPIAQQWQDAHPGEELPDYFVSAMELSAKDHIRVQAAIQRWVDSSISKTANAPHDFTVEETKELYELAFDLGCKGVTIYRDGSRDVQVLSTAKEEAQSADAVTSGGGEAGAAVAISRAGASSRRDEAGAAGARSAGAGVDGTVPGSGGTGASAVIETAAANTAAGAGSGAALAYAGIGASGQVLDKEYRRRPQVLRGATYKLNTPFGMAYITINDIDGTPGEIFLNVGKAGSDVFAMAEALGRVCSLFLRYGNHGSKVKLLVKHLKGIGGTGAIGFGANRVESIADAVAKALEMHMEAGPSPEAAAFDASAAKVVAATAEAAAAVHLKEGDELSYQHHHGSGSLTSLDLCPSCGAAALINTEGCKQCSNCGYSKCS